MVKQRHYFVGSKGSSLSSPIASFYLFKTINTPQSLLMTAVASTIFKIKAHTDFITKQPDQLSFRKGQPFYALSIDYEKGYYFVSTQYAVPFSRNAVNGLVPISMFDKVELLSKDTSYIKRKKVVLDKDTQSVPARKQSLTHNPDWKIIMESKIKSVIVLSIVENQYQIRVERQEASHVIKRSLQDILLVAQNVKEFKASEATESGLENIQLLLNTVLVYGNNDFFNPKLN